MLTAAQALVLKTAVQSFWNTYYMIPDLFEGLVYERTSTQKTDTYARLGAAPMPRAWVGDKDAKVANEYTYPVTNTPFEGTVKIDKELIKFQQWDEVSNLVGNLGEKARKHPQKLLTTVMVAGVSTVDEDGQFFFDTDHADPGAEYTTSQDNDKTSTAATGTQPTALEFAAAVRGMLDAFFSFKDDRGDPMVPTEYGGSDFIAMVPPVFASVANTVETATDLTGPIGNDLRGKFVTRVNPFMTAADQFFMFYKGSNHKPFIRQIVSDVNLDDNTDGDEFFRTGNISFSADWWGAVTYGQWRTGVSHIFT